MPKKNSKKTSTQHNLFPPVTYDNYEQLQKKQSAIFINMMCHELIKQGKNNLDIIIIVQNSIDRPILILKSLSPEGFTIEDEGANMNDIQKKLTHLFFITFLYKSPVYGMTCETERFNFSIEPAVERDELPDDVFNIYNLRIDLKTDTIDVADCDPK